MCIEKLMYSSLGVGDRRESKGGKCGGLPIATGGSTLQGL